MVKIETKKIKKRNQKGKVIAEEFEINNET